MRLAGVPGEKSQAYSARSTALLSFVLGVGCRLNGGFVFLSSEVQNLACERQTWQGSVWGFLLVCHTMKSFNFIAVSVPLKVQLT